MNTRTPCSISEEHLSLSTTMSPNLVELRQHNEDEWERMRPTIISLYLTHRLEAVVTIMKTKHGFGAT